MGRAGPAVVPRSTGRVAPDTAPPRLIMSWGFALRDACSMRRVVLWPGSARSGGGQLTHRGGRCRLCEGVAGRRRRGVPARRGVAPTRVLDLLISVFTPAAGMGQGVGNDAEVVRPLAGGGSGEPAVSITLSTVASGTAAMWTTCAPRYSGRASFQPYATLDRWTQPLLSPKSAHVRSGTAVSQARVGTYRSDLTASARPAAEPFRKGSPTWSCPVGFQ